MIRLNEYIGVLIPKSGAGLIKVVFSDTTVLVIETGTGNYHIYIGENADFEMAKNIIINVKTSRPSVCNVTEKMHISEKVAEIYLFKLEYTFILFTGMDKLDKYRRL